MKHIILTTLFSLLVSACYATEIEGIRDGVVHIKVKDEATNVTLRWQNAWMAGKNKETVYLQKPNGELIQALQLDKSNTKGTTSWQLEPALGSYRLEIPGQSFRKYTVNISGASPVIYEPVKHHFNLDTMVHKTWYFQKSANQAVKLGSKFYGGVEKLAVQCPSDADPVEMVLRKNTRYVEHDLLDLTVSGHNEMCKLTMVGNGKAAFWLDGQDNYFSRSDKQWFKPIGMPSILNISITDRVGNSPKLGIAVPNAVPPAQVKSKLRDLGMKFSSTYLFTDSYNLTHPIRNFYGDIAVTEDVAVIAKTGRIHELNDTGPSVRAAKHYFDTAENLFRQQKYLALADEPNLNYANYDKFEAYFLKAAAQIKADVPHAKIAIPASSRFYNAPTRDGLVDRTGMEWAKKLYKRAPQYVDAIVWNEWLHRDLINTAAVKDSIYAAADIVGLDNNGQPNKPLIIGQTNISSGLHLSTYEQDTFFAGLWWASTAVQAAETGLLSAINWFQLADEAAYPKGMLTEYPELARKPVAHVMAFLSEAWHPSVYKTTDEYPDVDTLMMMDEIRRKISVYIINKSERRFLPEVSMNPLFKYFQPTAYSSIDESGMKTGQYDPSTQLLIKEKQIVRIDYRYVGPSQNDNL